MHSDSAMLTGSEHYRVAECGEDYALHGECGDRAWGVVSDGCSDAGRSDVGARLWAMAVEAAIRRNDGLMREAIFDGGSVGHALSRVTPVLPPGVQEQDMPATVCCVAADESRAAGMLCGDGALLAIYANGSVEMVSHNFTRNMPFYPWYLSSQAFMESFIRRSNEMGQSMEIVRQVWDSNGYTIEEGSIVVPIDGHLRFQGSSYSFPLRDAEGGMKLKALLAVTDGIFSRPDRTVAAEDTIRELCGFKSWSGSFIRRRLGTLGARWMKESTAARDDLSAAGICWTEFEEQDSR
jgi:hypothetical protein